ncbi:MAG: mechanosensitive ion channel [Alphaproteobacteria bacterium]|nr:mechanosensitive ion channel [Alphaproteobacteria bacterium]
MSRKLALFFVFLICSASSLYAGDFHATVKDALVATATADNIKSSHPSVANKASSVLGTAETNKMIEALQDPEKRDNLLGELKKVIGDNADKILPRSMGVHQLWNIRELVSKDSIISTGLSLFRIGVILLIFAIFWRILNHVIESYANNTSVIGKINLRKNDTMALFKTVVPIARSCIHWILIVLGTLLILSELNINIMPIIYSFSVLGLAISIGSQTLVKDLINGVMTLLEGNMAVGDVITINNFTGTVESISLRCVHLRHGTGELQTIPFSEVTYVTNKSRDYNYADIQFMVAFEADMDKVQSALQTVFDSFQQDSRFSSYIQGPLVVSGVNRFTEWGVNISASIKIIPDPTKVFISEFYKRLWSELKTNDVDFPSSAILVK